MEERVRELEERLRRVERRGWYLWSAILCVSLLAVVNIRSLFANSLEVAGLTVLSADGKPRITMGTTPAGYGHLVFHNNETKAPLQLYLSDEGRGWVEVGSSGDQGRVTVSAAGDGMPEVLLESASAESTLRLIASDRIGGTASIVLHTPGTVANIGNSSQWGTSLLNLSAGKMQAVLGVTSVIGEAENNSRSAELRILSEGGQIVGMAPIQGKPTLEFRNADESVIDVLP